MQSNEEAAPLPPRSQSFFKSKMFFIALLFMVGAALLLASVLLEKRVEARRLEIPDDNTPQIQYFVEPWQQQKHLLNWDAELAADRGIGGAVGGGAVRGQGPLENGSSSNCVPGGPCNQQNADGNGVNPVDCQVYWSVTVPCASTCRGGFQVQYVTSISGPFFGGAPCAYEPGDVATMSCAGDVPSLPCLCNAVDFDVPDPTNPGQTFNPYFDANTIQTCGSCDGVNNGAPCYLTCAASLPYTGVQQGDKQITCMNGTWSAPQLFPSCPPQPTICPVIPEDASLGYVPGAICDGAGVDDVCIIYCNPGYTLAPGSAASATCMNSGVWSAQLGCVQVQQAPLFCPPMWPLEKFSVVNSYTCVRAALGDMCSITCNPNYTLTSNTSPLATCTLGSDGVTLSWSNIVNCDFVPP